MTDGDGAALRTPVRSMAQLAPSGRVASMRSSEQTTLVGLAGACAVLFFESVFHIVKTDPQLDGVAIFAAIVLATFSVYALTFQFFNYLDRRYLWRLRGPVCLSGRWASTL